VTVGLACAAIHHTIVYEPAMLIDCGKVCSIMISTSVGARKGEGRREGETTIRRRATK
jgi:hypothetical protein